MLLERLEADDGLGHSLRSNLKTAEERLETQTTARSGAWALLDDAKALAAAADLPGALRIYSNIGEPPALLARCLQHGHLRTACCFSHRRWFRLCPQIWS